MGRVRLLLLLACVALMTPACPDQLPPGDAGDAAWVQRASLFVQGRRVLDLGELEVLTSAVAQVGREEVARAMSATPEARARWSDFLYDHLFVNRVDARANEECFGDRHLDDGPDLALHIDANGVDAAFGAPWSMADLLASSLEADRLGPLFRANLFHGLPWGIQPLNLAEGQSFRRDLGEIFTSRYLGRNLVCLPCHNSEVSVTGSDDPANDRTWELPGHLERALFGASEGRDPEDLHTLFRRRGVVADWYFAQETPPSDAEDLFLYGGCTPIEGFAGCAGCACEEAVCADQPSCCAEEWTPECAAACAALGLGCERDLPDDFDGCVAAWGVEAQGCGGCACEAAVCALDDYCCDGEWDAFCAAFCREEDGSGCEVGSDGNVQPWGEAPGCGEFVPPEQVVDDLSGHPGFFIEDAGADGSIWHIEAQLAAGIDALGGRTLIPPADGSVDGPEAFAQLLAMNLADAVWAEAFGAPLTVSHGFPRNQAQRDRLHGLTGIVTSGGFGLRELLVAVATDDLFNAGAPVEVGVEPYRLDPVVDPFSVEAEVEEQRGNGVGDVVHRLSARVQMSALESALGWAPQRRFPDDEQAQFQERIGAFLKDTSPGFDGVGFQGLLAWEGGTSKCRREGEDGDFIQRVLRAAEEQDATWEAVVLTIKERLITEPTLHDAERAPLEAWMQVSLGDVVSGAEEDERAARSLCGALLSSPQFLMEGLPPLSPEPSNALTLDGASLGDHCRTWQARLTKLTCGG